MEHAIENRSPIYAKLPVNETVDNPENEHAIDSPVALVSSLETEADVSVSLTRETLGLLPVKPRREPPSPPNRRWASKMSIGLAQPVTVTAPEHLIAAELLLRQSHSTFALVVTDTSIVSAIEPPEERDRVEHEILHEPLRAQLETVRDVTVESESQFLSETEIPSTSSAASDDTRERSRTTRPLTIEPRTVRDC